MLISAVGQDIRALAAKMNIQTDAIMINQCDTFSYLEYQLPHAGIRCFQMKEKGVGLSRNTALMRADGDICVFADEDIVYDHGYAAVIENAFCRNEKADILLFNIRVAPSRRTYWNDRDKRIRWYNYGRYPAYSIAAKTESLHCANVSFSLLFGGGARYSNGEDSLFLKDCLKKGLKIYAVTAVLGEEKERESTWFHGYTDKFFTDRGVLYHYLYGRMAILFTLRFLLAHRKEMCVKTGLKQAFFLMKQGIGEAKG